MDIDFGAVGAALAALLTAFVGWREWRARANKEKERSGAALLLEAGQTYQELVRLLREEIDRLHSEVERLTNALHDRDAKIDLLTGRVRQISQELESLKRIAAQPIPAPVGSMGPIEA